MTPDDLRRVPPVQQLCFLFCVTHLKRQLPSYRTAPSGKPMLAMVWGTSAAQELGERNIITC